MEACRAQGFPDHEVLLGRMADQWRMVGNAVARPVALALGLAFREAWVGTLWDDGKDKGPVPVVVPREEEGAVPVVVANREEAAVPVVVLNREMEMSAGDLVVVVDDSDSDSDRQAKPFVKRPTEQIVIIIDNSDSDNGPHTQPEGGEAWGLREADQNIGTRHDASGRD